jgi:hypothetical protein
VTVAARKRKNVTVTFPLPSDTGSVWLVALFEPQGAPPVMSQREVCICAPAAASATLKKRAFRVVGADAAAREWFEQAGLDARFEVPYGRYTPDADVLVVWEDLSFSYQNRHVTEAVGAFLAAGRKVLIMQQHAGWDASKWHWSGSAPSAAALSYPTSLHRSSLMLPDSTEIARQLWKGLGRTAISHPNGLHNAACYTSLGTLPSSESLPARTSPTGQQPLGAEVLVIDTKVRSATTFAADHADPLHVAKATSGAKARSFERLRSKTPSLLCTRKAPRESYAESYPFESANAIDGVWWVFGQGRQWASPFQWRIDNGEWQLVGTALPMIGWESLASDGPTFAWSRLGYVKASAGRHVLQVKVTEAKSDETYLLSQECFMIAPRQTRSEYVARSGDGEPLMAAVKLGSGTLYISQMLMAQRLNHTGPSYDPVVEKLMLNLLGM